MCNIFYKFLTYFVTFVVKYNQSKKLTFYESRNYPIQNHQNVMVFYKGDPKKIKDNFPELNLGELEEPAEVI